VIGFQHAQDSPETVNMFRVSNSIELLTDWNRGTSRPPVKAARRGAHAGGYSGCCASNYPHQNL